MPWPLEPSPALAEAASAQALVLLCWILVLTSLTIWVRRRVAFADSGLVGTWKRYPVEPPTVSERPCRWQVGSARMASGLQKWHCESCGLDGFSATKGPPDGCNWVMPSE
ncbi:MAG: hypothetical protein AB3N23_13500 [Paracoccaceae bacterium]